MAEWGRKEYSKAWPSRTPVWTVMAFLLTPLFLAGLLTWQYERSWTEAERLYLTDYLKSGTRGQASASASSKYTMLEAVVGKSQRLVIDDEIERVSSVDGRPGYRLTDEGVKDGIARLTWVTGVFNDRGLHRVMSQAVYADHEAWTFYRIHTCHGHRSRDEHGHGETTWRRRTELRSSPLAGRDGLPRS
jgi:hypothetical protein